MKISIRQLSEITGYSSATVSNALNRKKGVNKETSRNIFAAAKKYGYLGECKIDSLTLVIYKNEGLVVSDTPFFSALIEGVESESKVLGYKCNIVNLYRNSPDFSEAIEKLMSDYDTGILLLATELSGEDIQIFNDAQVPLVILDGYFEESTASSVLIENMDSVRKAIEYLIGRGHKEIGYIKSKIRINNFLERETGYQIALAKNGLSTCVEYTFNLTPTLDLSYQEMHERLQTRPKLPTAFFAENDILALGAMKALNDFGYKIPEDISIIGFDDLPYCCISSPPLTTIHVFKREMGQTAVKRLVSLINNENYIKTKIEICTNFIERNSVRDLLAL